MSKYNSIRSVNFLLYLIILLTTGCSEKVTTQAFINEPPPTIQVEVAPPAFDQNKYLQNKEQAILRRIEQKKQSKIKFHTVWDRLLSLYALPEVSNSRVEKEVQRYLKNPEYLVKLQQRAEPYLYFILEQIELKQIPGEIALLPIVESAFLPHALSHSKASGLWQFMPATGRFFGLKQNQWYDGRKDIYTSTQAAITYLDQLASEFDNDWFLALASYNAGKGTVRKAIRKNKKKQLETDYWSLSLHRETMSYVPRLLAVAKIFANAEQYNINLLPFPNTPHFTVVNIESQIDLNIAAEMANTPIDHFLTLNPAFKGWVTDPDGPYHLLVHVDKSDAFKQTLARTIKKDRLKWIRHRIKSGENLILIARNYNTSVNAISQTNNLKNNHIRAGNILLIPSAIKNIKQLYIVKKGDTFWDIARQFDVHSKDIANWNNLSLTTALQPGQKLIIKKG